jgi:tRNA A37 methylthiotransferase MiaB
LRRRGWWGKKTQQIEQREQQTYREQSDGVDSQLINVGIAHGCDCSYCGVVDAKERYTSSTSDVVVESAGKI